MESNFSRVCSARRDGGECGYERTGRVNTEILFCGNKFIFTKEQLCEDPLETYKYTYWAYDVLFDDKFVFGIEVKKDWAGGKPELDDITGYVPGSWEESFLAMKAQSEEIAREHARKATKNKRVKQSKKQEDHLRRFGIESDKNQ